MRRTTSSALVADRPLALVRGVARSFSSAVTGSPPEPPLSADLAASQHTVYVAALEAGGYATVKIEPDEQFPDCCFIEDAAVVVGEHALMTRSGHPSRRGEADGVASILGEYVRLHHTRAPATVDGGDVMVLGSRVFVGLSRRTNAAGVAALAAIAEPQGMSVETVPVGSVLHLKSGLSALDDSTALWHRRACERGELTGLRIIEAEGDDPEAANVVRLADGRILVAEHHEATRNAVEALGFETVAVDVSEFARADGGLTCMSIRLR
jgi:dimethylargininase